MRLTRLVLEMEYGVFGLASRSFVSRALGLKTEREEKIECGHCSVLEVLKLGRSAPLLGGLLQRCAHKVGDWAREA